MCILCRDQQPNKLTTRPCFCQGRSLSPVSRDLCCIWGQDTPPRAAGAWEGPAGPEVLAGQTARQHSSRCLCCDAQQAPQAAVVPGSPSQQEVLQLSWQLSAVGQWHERSVASHIARAAAERQALASRRLTTDRRRLSNMISQQRLGGPAGPGELPKHSCQGAHRQEAPSSCCCWTPGGKGIHLVISERPQGGRPFRMRAITARAEAWRTR